MAVVGGVVGRLPAAVFIIVGLIVGPAILEAIGVTPDVMQHWLGDKILYDIQVAVAFAPLLIALAILTGLVFMVGTHHVAATISGLIGVAFFVLDVIWHMGFGLWATAHLTGAA